MKMARRMTAAAMTLVMALVMAFGFSGCAGVKEYLWPTPTTAAPPKPTSNITIIPGWSIIQVAEALEKAEICSADGFLEAAKVVPPGYDTLVNGLGSAEGYLFAAEGFILPQTHNIYQNSNPDNVVKFFLDYTAKQINALSYNDVTAYSRVEQLDMNMYEIFTLASIIQYEANLSSTEKDFEVMQQVSSVFHNRLKNRNKGYKYLGSDATRNYIEKKMKDYIETAGLDYDYYFGNYCTNDSYTSKTAGLPAGPICAPSVNALKAALWPADTGYFFFFSDKDGDYHFYENYNDFQNDWNNKYKH